MRKRVQSLLRARQGLAALEFAMTAPVLLMLFLGSFDTIRYLVYVDLARRATIAASNAATNTATAGVALSSSLLGTILKQVEQQTSSYIWTGMGQTNGNTVNGIVLSVVELDSTGNKFRLDTQAKYPTSLTNVSVYGCQTSSTFTNTNAQQISSKVPNDMFLAAELFFTYKPFVLSSSLFNNSSILSMTGRALFRIRQPVTPGNGGTC